VSEQNDPDETQRVKATDHTPSRRSILLGGTTLVAASALGASASMQFAQAQTPLSQPKPNILFILVDNLGYGELGVYGGRSTCRVGSSRR
jgi:arylsulfatase